MVELLCAAAFFALVRIYPIADALLQSFQRKVGAQLVVGLAFALLVDNIKNTFLRGIIAEGHSVLISAGLLHGRNVAAPAELRPDIGNARGLWAGPGAFVDGNLVSAGSTDNLPDSLSALITGMQLQ